MAATNAAGTTTVRYGKMRANVLALEAVLPGGRVVRAGSRAPKTSAGYDLLGLLIGSEGTLAVITELTLRLHGIPEHAVALRLSFADVDGACRAATAIVAAGARRDPGRAARRLDDRRRSTPTRAPTTRRAPTLFVEAAGSEATVDGGRRARAGARGGGGRDRRRRRARPDRARAALGGAPRVRLRLGRGDSRPEITLDRRLRAALGARRRAGVRPRRAERLGLIAGIVGHAGDGNVHLSLHVDPDDEAELRASDELVELLVDDALARGGTCTGEHGIGLGKIAALEREHGDLVPLMRGIKALFDPNGIMNPGKVLRPGA